MAMLPLGTLPFYPAADARQGRLVDSFLAELFPFRRQRIDPQVSDLYGLLMELIALRAMVEVRAPPPDQSMGLTLLRIV